MGGARPGRDEHRHALRLSQLPRAVVHLDGARASSSSRWSPCCSARRSTAAAAGSASAGFGVQPSELAKLSAIFFIAALLERRMDRIDEIPYALVPIGVVVGGLVGLILLEPDLGTAMTLLLDRGGDGVRGRAQLSIRRRRDSLRPSRRVFHPDGRRVSPPPADGVLGSVERSARRRIPGHPVADRGGIRRADRARIHGGRAEAVLSAGAAHRLHLRRHRRGVRPAGHDARAGVLHGDRVARLQDRDAGAGSLRRVSRGRADDDDRGAGIFQHQRRARARADQRAFRCRS